MIAAICPLVMFLAVVTTASGTAASDALTIEDRAGMSEYVQKLMRREGFETVVHCSGVRLSIDILSMFTEEGKGKPVNLLATLAAVGALLKAVHDLEGDFLLKVRLSSGDA